MINEKFVFLGAVLNIIGSVGYIRDTLRGRTKPNRVSFSLWALAPLIAFVAEIKQGVGIQSLMTFMVGFGPLLILIASFANKKSLWQLSRFDYFCGVLSLLGLLMWAITRHGNIAIAFSIMSDGLAALPTIVKSWKDPSSENGVLFLLGAISAGITLLTIRHWDFAHYGFPIYILIVCLVISSIVMLRLGEKIPKSEANTAKPY